MIVNYCAKKNPKMSSLLRNKLNLDFLAHTYNPHLQAVEELALNQVCSLEPIVPPFSSIACLVKNDINMLMKKIEKKLLKKSISSKVFTASVAIITDTLTCMIKNNLFYEEYAGDNTDSINLMINLLERVCYIIRLTKGFPSECPDRLPSLIAILERSAARIKDCNEYHSILEIITDLKVMTENKENFNKNKKRKLDASQSQQLQLESNNNTILKSRNNMHKPEMEQSVVDADNLATLPGSLMLQVAVHNNSVKEVNIHKTEMEQSVVDADDPATLPDSPTLQVDVHNNPVKKVNIHKPEMEQSVVDADDLATLPDSPTLQVAVHTTPVNINKPKNAFEVMMMASKNRAVKRKATS